MDKWYKIAIVVLQALVKVVEILSNSINFIKKHGKHFFTKRHE